MNVSTPVPTFIAPAPQQIAMPSATKVKTNISFLDILGHLVLWLVLIIITLGIGLFFVPYSFANFVINRTYVTTSDGRPVARLQSGLDLSGQIGHIILWIIISVVTLGFGYFFYIYKVWATALNTTRIVPE